jgi:hypothetical protein
MIALDIVLLFALTARWPSVLGEISYQKEWAGSADRPDDPLHGHLPHETTQLRGPRTS